MDLKDATLMFLSESAEYPAVSSIAQSAYDRLAAGEDVDYEVLDELVGEASAKGVLQAMGQKYSPTAYEAIIAPVLREIGRRKPIRSAWQPSTPPGSADDPLTAPAWPSR
ncbi:MAG: hypothetical protein J2P25_03775 [Nocardiopsaceae bacterium]|nr:hypothetical protein [Nocardiopsaceae bacterium]